MSAEHPNKGRADEAPRWLDDPRNVQRIVNVLCGTCVLLVLADLVYHKHVHYDFENWFGFYGFYGFVSCVVLVRAAVLMRRFLMRDEAHYEPVDDPPTATDSAASASSPQGTRSGEGRKEGASHG